MDSNYTLLMEYAKSGEVEKIRQLKWTDDEPFFEWMLNDAIVAASHEGHGEIVLMMIDNGADPDYKNGLAIFKAISLCDDNLLDELIKRDVAFNQEALDEAMGTANIYALNRMIEAGLDLQTSNIARMLVLSKSIEMATHLTKNLNWIPTESGGYGIVNAIENEEYEMAFLMMASMPSLEDLEHKSNIVNLIIEHQDKLNLSYENISKLTGKEGVGIMLSSSNGLETKMLASNKNEL